MTDTIKPPMPTPMVFLPFITLTHAPLFECDYNLHKSNSTYFTDLDSSRSHLLSALCYTGLRSVDRELTAEGKPGMLAAIIGAVTTSFKREIPMFQQYEVWSRILTWDRKWLYIITHFIRKGSVEPKGFLSGSTYAGRKDGKTEKQPVVYATSVSKYVFKKGRLTVSPDRVLRASGLFHLVAGGAEATGDHVEKSQQTNTSKAPSESEKTATIPHFKHTGEPIAYLDTIEEERLRGLQFAEAWANLDILHDRLLTENEENDVVVAIRRCRDIPGIIPS